MSSMGDFFETGTDDPEGQSASKTGMQKGVAIGSMFGPVGAAIGGAIGMVFGMGQGDGARMRARRKATQQSYRFGQDAYSYIGKGREETQKTYESKKSYARARLGASGAVLEGSPQWQSATGYLARERDTALKGLDAEQKEFRKSESYKWLKTDYAYLGNVRKGYTPSGRDRDDDPVTTYKIGTRYKGRSNRKMFTAEQYNSLRKYKGHRGAGLDLYKEYAERVTPDMDLFEKGMFGSDAEKKAYKAEVGANVTAANKWYDDKIAEAAAQAQAQRDFYNSGRNRFQPRGEGPQR